MVYEDFLRRVEQARGWRLRAVPAKGYFRMWECFVCGIVGPGVRVWDDARLLGGSVGTRGIEFLTDLLVC